MTHICLVCGADGLFRSCSATGHSGFAVAGSDIVCAAVSVLLRTTLQVLTEHFGAAVKTDFSSRGKLAFYVEDISGKEYCRLIYAAEFLRNGFRSLQEEYPEYISLREEIEN